MAESQTGESLTNQTVTSATWSTALRVGQQALSVVSLTAMAHLLPPAAFGLVGMATLVSAAMDSFKEFGMPFAIVQRAELDDEFLSSVFWISMLLGLAFCAGTVAVSPLVALFFHEPRVASILSVLSLSFPLSAAALVHSALVTREMAFQKICIAELSGSALGTASGITAAVLGAGPWSLVIASLVNVSVGSILFWIVCRWRPRFYCRWSDIRSIASFSLNISGFAIVNYAARNADNVIIGRFLGATELGYYQMAYNLMLYPIQAINSIVGRVLFPAFARIQHDRPRLQSAYLRAIATIGAIAFPAMLGLIVTAGPFIHTFLGKKWEPVVTLFLILAPVGLIQSVLSPGGNIYIATGRTDWFFRWGIIASSVSVIGFLIGIKWGAIGVASAYVVTNLILLYPNLKIPFKLIELPMRLFFARLAPLFGIGLIMAAVCLLWRLLCQSAGIDRPLIVLASTSVIGAIVYFTLCLRLNPPGIDEMVGMLPAGKWPWLDRAVRVASGRS